MAGAHEELTHPTGLGFGSRRRDQAGGCCMQIGQGLFEASDFRGSEEIGGSQPLAQLLQGLFRKEHDRLLQELSARQEEAQRQHLDALTVTVERLLGAASGRHASLRCYSDRAATSVAFDMRGAPAVTHRSSNDDMDEGKEPIVMAELSPNSGGWTTSSPTRAIMVQVPSFGVGAAPMASRKSPRAQTMPSQTAQAPRPGSRLQLPATACSRRGVTVKVTGGDSVSDGQESADDKVQCVVESPPGARTPSILRKHSMALSDLRSEATQENERFKHQWRHHIRAQVTRRLDNISSGSILARALSGLFGETSNIAMMQSPHHTRESIQDIQYSPHERGRLEHLVDSSIFHSICGLVIVLNAIFIGLQTDVSVRNVLHTPPLKEPAWYAIVSYVFIIFFGIEVVLRLAGKRAGFFLGSDWKWNLFDVVLVAYSAAEACITHFETEGNLSLTYTRLIRGFRMVRVLRVIRVMRFFRELRLLVCSVMQSVVSLSWAMVLMVIIIYLFTICFMHAAYIYLQEGGTPEVRDGLAKWYGTLPNGMFSLLMAVTGGDDWINFVGPLAAISPVYQVLFGIYVFFVLIGVVNVVTSAFVQRACELSKLDRDLVIQGEMVAHESFLAEMRDIFEEVDADGSGKITWDKFRQFMENDQVQAYFATQQLDTTDARELFTLLDAEGTDSVGLEEFIMGCKRLRGQAKSTDVATLQREHHRTNRKFTRQMRRIEAQLGALCGVMNVGLDSAGWTQGLRSPSSVVRPYSSRAGGGGGGGPGAGGGSSGGAGAGCGSLYGPGGGGVSGSLESNICSTPGSASSVGRSRLRALFAGPSQRSKAVGS